MKEAQAITIDCVRELLKTYESAGLEDVSTRFLKNVIEEKQIPVGSRGKWLEDLFRREVGLKQARDLIQLASKSRRNDIADTLRDFARILSKGYELSDRQKKLLEALRQQVVDELPDKDLTDRDRHLLRGLGESKRNNSMYWSHRSSTSRQLDRIFKRFYEEDAISSSDWDYVRSNFKGKVEDFEGFSKKHSQGSLRWLFQSGAWAPVVIVSDSKFSSNGHITVDIMHKGGVSTVGIESLRINKPK